jgi:hypothetical protein
MLYETPDIGRNTYHFSSKPSGKITGTPGSTSESGLSIPYGSRYIPGISEYLDQLTGENAIKTYDEMRRSDSTIAAILSAITLPIRRARYYIEPGEGEKPIISETIEKNLFSGMLSDWDSVIRNSLLMLTFGFSVLEKIWKYENNLYMIKDLAVRPPQTVIDWIENHEGELTTIVQRDIAAKEFKIPRQKAILFVNEQEGNNWSGRSILRAAYRPWVMKKDVMTITCIQHDRHGVGIPMAHVPTHVKEGTVAYKNTVSVLNGLYANDQSHIVAPTGYDFKIYGGDGKAGTDTIPFLRYLDEQIAESVLAMFMNLGTTATGSRALGSEFTRFFVMSIQTYADYLCEVINRSLIHELVDYNWSNVKNYPSLRVERIQEVDLSVIPNLIKTGAITADTTLESFIRDCLNLPQLPEKTPVTIKEELPVTEEQIPDEDIEEETQEKIKEENEQEDKTNLSFSINTKDIPPEFQEIKIRLDLSYVSLLNKIKRIKEAQFDSVIKQVVDGKKIQNINVPHKKELHDVLMEEYANQFKEGVDEIKKYKEKGLTSVNFAVNPNEVKKQKKIPPIFKKFEDYRIYFGELLATLIAGISNKLISIIYNRALNYIHREKLSGLPLETALREIDISGSNWDKIASQTINMGWGDGRAYEINLTADDIDYCYYSAILDENVCINCLPKDGEIHAPGDLNYITPNPNCYGNCRCMTIAVYKQESMPEEEFEKYRQEEE